MHKKDKICVKHTLIMYYYAHKLRVNHGSPAQNKRIMNDRTKIEIAIKVIVNKNNIYFSLNSAS